MKLADLLVRLEKDGILLLSDAKLPSVVSLVVGAPAKGSWWSHQKGREIYALLEELGDHEDVLAAKLVAGKVTFVHRRLWPSLLAIASAREPWQMKGLSSAARRLLARVEAEGALEAIGVAVKELAVRLLVHTEQVHTKTGSHALVLTSWSHWAKRHAPIGRAVPLATAKKEVEAALDPSAVRPRRAGSTPFGWLRGKV